MGKDGKVNLGQVGDAPFVIPKDLASVPRVFAAMARVEKNGPVASVSSTTIKLVSAAATPALSLLTASSSTSATAISKQSSGSVPTRSQASLVGVFVIGVAFIIL